MVNGAKLAVADLNAKGGALGKKFSLQSYNDQASATLSSQLFQRLVSAGAVAVAGSGDTGPATAAMAQRLHIPNIGAVDDAGITIYPNGPSKPPFEWVWSWGLNTFAWGGAPLALAAFLLLALQPFLGSARWRSIRHAASEKAHFRWALPIFLPPEPFFLPADSCSQRTSRA